MPIPRSASGAAARGAASTAYDRRPPLRALLTESSVIPAIRDPSTIDRAVAAHGRIIYLLCCNPENLDDLALRIEEAGKIAIVNVDLMGGFSRDRYALRYLAAHGVAGVISTHAETLRQAQSLGLYVVQRTFLLDSAAMAHICSQLKTSTVDALEVLPAVAVPKLVAPVKAIAPEIPLVGGGLIANMAEIATLLDQGISAISTSDPQLWVP